MELLIMHDAEGECIITNIISGQAVIIYYKTPPFNSSEFDQISVNCGDLLYYERVYRTQITVEICRALRPGLYQSEKCRL